MIHRLQIETRTEDERRENERRKGPRGWDSAETASRRRICQTLACHSHDNVREISIYGRDPRDEPTDPLEELVLCKCCQKIFEAEVDL